MGLFVHEYFSSGAYPGELRQSSLAREGLAMLEAVLEDFAGCLDGCFVGRAATTLDRRLATDARKRGLTDWANVHWAESAQHERDLFQKLAAQAEATFVIAPESDGILLARRRLVERAGGRFLGHSADAIRLCSDKLAFHDHLRRHELPTVPTRLFDPSTGESTFPFPIVVKPRDGAGSQDTFLVRDDHHLSTLRAFLSVTFPGGSRQAIVQPFVAGPSLSVAAIVDSPSGSVEVFPVADQHLSDDGRFQYQGGEIPASLPGPVELAGVVTQICHSIAGLAGYVGFDLILASHSSRVFVVEANPRLTTSYLGYRALAKENLAAKILQPASDTNPIAWTTVPVEFQADGWVHTDTH